ncbi:hypothetical protein IH992_26780 [Candidatus Poribacteria bacterium]|nr:hypothetical protein [Candidatus Poribacteria bacterium]
MIVKHAKDVARQWVIEEASKSPSFYGAFYHGSTNWLPDDAVLPATSDVDVMVVLADPNPPDKLGKFIYRDVILEVSYLPSHQFQSPDQILGQYHMAGSFRTPSIILDASGQLTKLHAAVSEDYAKRKWVYKRCEHARDKVLRNLQGLNESEPFHDQVVGWLFATGVTTHVLLVAGLKNPTVRRRYVAAQELLADYSRLDFYEILLSMLGCAQMSRGRVEHHLATLIDVFDVAKTMVKTPFFFASDISDIARPIAIDGSLKLIERGYHREAIFWIVATYSRCQKVLYHDAPVEIQDRFSLGYRQLLGDLGITSFADLQQRNEQVKALLPRVWEEAEAIIAANPEIEA